MHPRQGKESRFSEFSFPLSDLQSQGQLPRERKEISMNAVIQLKKATPLFVVSFVFACLAFSSAPNAFGVSPPPDGGYPGGNTAEGENALFRLSETDGSFNTAVGWLSLSSDVVGGLNTAVGAGALALNTSHNNTATGAGALLLNTTGTGNTAVGAAALHSNTGGTGKAACGNTAVAAATRRRKTGGSGNAARAGAV